MTVTKDQALDTLLARLAGRDMLGFGIAREAEAVALAKVGSGKAGSLKPPPVIPPSAKG
jgi:hypothetical protein